MCTFDNDEGPTTLEPADYRDIVTSERFAIMHLICFILSGITEIVQTR